MAVQASLLNNNNFMKPEQTIYYVVDGKDKPIWRPCGAMWQNKKGGYQIHFDIVPVPTNGRLVSMPFRSKKAQEPTF